MCQPGRPRPHGDSQDVSSPSFVVFQSAKSRTSSFSGLGSSLLDLIEPVAGEGAVAREARDPEVDVPARLVGMTGVDQLLDQRDDLRDRLRRERLLVRHLEAERSGVLQVPGGRITRARGAGAGRGLVDLVVDVGDVVDVGHLVAALAEPVAEPGEDDERDGVADVRPLVDGRAADVHPHLRRRRRAARRATFVAVS